MQDDVEVKLMMGDELRLKHRCPSGRPAWEGTGHVIITGGSSEEVKPTQNVQKDSLQHNNLSHADSGLLVPQAVVVQLLLCCAQQALTMLSSMQRTGPVAYT